MNYVMTYEQFSGSYTYPLKKSGEYRIFKTEFGDDYSVRVISKTEKVNNLDIPFMELYFYVGGNTDIIPNKGNVSRVLNTIGKSLQIEIKANKKNSFKGNYRIIWIDGIRKENMEFNPPKYKYPDTREVSKRSIAYMRYFPKFLPEYKMVNVGDKIVFYLPEVETEAFQLLGVQVEKDQVA